MISADKIDWEFWGYPHIGTTQFRVASTEADYDDCMDLIAENGWPVGYQLLHPTIMAERDGYLIGMIGTRVSRWPEDEPFLAGPLAIRTDMKRPVLAYKLLVQYERAMRTLGWDHIIFDVDIGSAMEIAIQRATGMTRLVVIGNVAYYNWNFNNIRDPRNEEAA